MREYTVKAPNLGSNTLKCYKAEDKEELEDKLREDGLDCYDIVNESEVTA